MGAEFYNDKEENPPASGEVNQQLKAYLDTVEDVYGLRPIIYATKLNNYSQKDFKAEFTER